MAKTKIEIKQVLACSNCKEEIDLCNSCKEYFKREKEEIECDEMDGKHYCKECQEEEEIEVGNVILEEKDEM